MTATDPTFARITDAVNAFRAGDAAAARRDLLAAWAEIGPMGDAFHRCTLAHYLADMYDDPAQSLIWDLRALDAADALSDNRVQQQHSSLHVAGFYPSLHLNLADDLRRLGSFDAAAEHIERARESLHTLGDDDYGAVIRTAVAEVARGD
ncbi:MAG TPA: hypothetical protein VIW24_06055 [Aldersonia sp.]